MYAFMSQRNRNSDKIFENPPLHIRKEMENMTHDGTLQVQFCCLCLCVMFDQLFNLTWLRMWDADDVHGTIHTNPKHILNRVCDAFKFDLNTSDRSKLLEPFDALNGSYCREVSGINCCLET